MKTPKTKLNEEKKFYCWKCLETFEERKDVDEHDRFYDPTPKAEVHCLNINCPERKGGKCTAEAKVKDWWEDYDWRKELDEKFVLSQMCWEDDEDIVELNGKPIGGTITKHDREFDRWYPEYKKEVKEFIETLLIKILAKCESAKDARECRHIIKEFILKEHN